MCRVHMVGFKFFECVVHESLRGENSHQRVYSLGNGVETAPTIYFPPSHRFSASCSYDFIHHTKMSTHGDVSLLDSVSSRVLNDFRDEVAKPRYSHNKHKFEVYPPDILKRLHFQQRPDISQ